VFWGRYKICSAGITYAQASSTRWYQPRIDVEPVKVQHFAANGGNWQFTQYKIHWRKFTKYAFQLNSAIVPFPWQLRILFRWNWIEQFIRSWMIPSFIWFDHCLMSTIFENKKWQNVWESIGENGELRHAFWTLLKNWSLISLFHDLRTENNQ